MDNKYAPIYIGIGLARAHQGQFATAREALETARSLAQDPVDVQKN
jgi:GTP cyclohydrolase III